MQTREKFYFICDKWFALDKGDLCIERIVHVSISPEKTRFQYLFSRQIKQKLNDTHLWYSIFARSLQSSFTRLDRLTCCFVLLSISMLINILYYGMDDTPIEAGIKIGPYINFTVQQLSIGVLTSVFVFIPSFLLVQMFRRTKRRNPRLARIKRILRTKNKETKRAKKPLELRFPWWFIIVAYVVSFLLVTSSLFFVLLKGIEFGNEKATKWLTSMIVAFLSSIFLTQPLQVSSLKFSE